ncbi:hypothetical protein [Streptomyces sp. XD-27]|uniref:hypothetical protein n=1 Tax=Streptomyces sp. XD-27 TaxID=3062779 RepID=UPI0026F41994|nr:hypothetical protein [Streptomyces sp. XD-27]WKX68796.1 hypothetical protein Q3Y56_01630 [Streptomyces sp. XD-27]
MTLTGPSHPGRRMAVVAPVTGRPADTRALIRGPAPALAVSVTSETGRHSAVVRLSDPSRWSVEVAAAPGGAVDVHLSVDPGVRQDPAWAACADVLHWARSSPPGLAFARVRWLLDRHPGCLIASVAVRGGGCVVGARSGEIVAALPEPGSNPSGEAGRCAGLVSFLHGWLVAGRPLTTLAAAVVARAGTASRLRIGPPAPVPRRAVAARSVR